MYVRYKPWSVDGLDTHTKVLGHRRYIFEDAQQGVLDVRLKRDLEAMLADPSHRYELAYDHYGVAFDELGEEVQVPSIVAPGLFTAPTTSNDTDVPPDISVSAFTPPDVRSRTRGRPRRVR